MIESDAHGARQHQSPTGASADSARFVRQAHDIVRDLFRPRPTVYWFDFLMTMGIAVVSFIVYLRAPWFSWVQLGAWVACGLAMYRAVVFTHEITHGRGSDVPGFAVAWNALCGVPFLVPTFLYGDHQGHHSNQAYGTWSDPEYLLRGRRWRLRVAAFLLAPLVYPVLASVRFLCLTPSALLSRRADRLVWTWASSLYVMNEAYRRPWDARAGAPARWLQEAACCLWAWLVVVLAISGLASVELLVKTFLVFLVWIVINQVRTLVSHRYAFGTSESSTYLQQLLDTHTFPRGGVFSALWAPVGLKYHALHHLFPAMPYHNMRRAHERLMRELPRDSAYHQTVKAGLWPVLIEMLRARAEDGRAAPQ